MTRAWRVQLQYCRVWCDMPPSRTDDVVDPMIARGGSFIWVRLPDMSQTVLRSRPRCLRCLRSELYAFFAVVFPAVRSSLTARLLKAFGLPIVFATRPVLRQFNSIEFFCALRSGALVATYHHVPPTTGNCCGVLPAFLPVEQRAGTRPKNSDVSAYELAEAA